MQSVLQYNQMISSKCYGTITCSCNFQLVSGYISRSAGVRNCLKPLNPRILLYASLQKVTPPPFYDDDFFQRCNELTKQCFNIDLFQDICATNCVCVYKFLVNNIA